MADTPTPTPARVTREDVLAALGNTDPTRTNASAIRAILGRGGNTTIQRLLDEIRAERFPLAALDQAAAAPAAPSALVDAVWSVAWSHAQTHTFARLDSVTSERDQLKSSLDVLNADHAALLSDVDDLRDALEQQTESESVKLDVVGAQVQELSAQLALAQAETAALKQQLAQAAELARRDDELKTAAHQRDREHLLNQVAEMKALLFRSPDTAR